jgi:hypothetical protein
MISFDGADSGTSSDVLVSFLLDVGTFVERLWNVCSFTELEFFKKSMGPRNRGGIGLSYRPAWLRRLAEFIPWNRFLGSINV